MRSLAILIALAACDGGRKPAPKPSPDPTPVPSAEKTRHKNAMPRSMLATDQNAALLPLHGAAATRSGDEGESTVILDQDAKTLRRIEKAPGKAAVESTRKLEGSVVDGIMKLAFAAWDEQESGAPPEKSDIREDLYVGDGDETFYVSGWPLSSPSGTDRPLAGQTLTALFKTPD